MQFGQSFDSQLERRAIDATRVATLKEAENQTESENSGRAISEFGAATIDFNPGPDAEGRLRRNRRR
ncbi:MAG: hypothetical protein OXL35_00045 [Chloroflexota bacterium]|nr:hypothetical protein [Chloroflexota bacterium]